MSAFEALMAFERETCALEQVAGRLGWDQETMMPPGAGAQRAEELGVMQAIIHARRTDPRLGDWLAAAQAEDEVGLAQLRHMRRNHARATRVPAALAVEIARVTSTAQGIWAAARKDDDFSAFAPVLQKVLALKREQAAALAQGGDLYDALLEDYEPQTSAREIEAIFTAMRPRLVALREQALAHPPRLGLSGHLMSRLS
jgi:carboxypeptidase Taq